MPTATLTSKGQITLPKAIRERLTLQAGDVLDLSVDESGRIVARPAGGTSGVCGSLKQFAPAQPLSVDAMKEAVRGRMRRKAGASDQ